MISTEEFPVNKLPAVIDHLYRNHHSWLYQWLRTKIGNSEQAADLVQDTFIKIIQTRDELLGIKEPRAYLTSIAKNLLIDHIRRKKIEQAYLDGLSHLQFTLDNIPSPEDQIQLIQAVDQLCQILEQVSEKAQKAFIWHYLDGFTHREIAEKLQVSTKMVQKYLAQCLIQCYLVRTEMEELV